VSEESASIKQRLSALSADRAALVELLANRKPAGAPEPRLSAQGEPDPSAHLPASWAQQSLWFIDQLEGGGAAYNIPVVLDLRGELDRRALRRALVQLVHRHAILRAKFVNVEGDLRLQIAAPGRFEVTVTELDVHDPDERAVELQRLKLEEAQARFDLDLGAPIRARLVGVDPMRHVLLITAHHIVSDGWSIGVMVRELAQCYAAYRADREPTLSALPIQYFDYARWQRQWLSGGVLERQLDYWRGSLTGAPPQIELPTDRPRRPVQRFHGRRMRFELGPALSTELRAFAREHGVTHFAVLLAAWSIVLSRLSGQVDLVIGTPVANRPRPELEGLIGLFVNALPLRVQLSMGASVPQFLEQIQHVTLTAFDHQDTPFEQIVEALRPERSLNRHPLFQVMFILHVATQVQWQWPGLSVAVEDSANETSKFDLLLSLEERGKQFAGSVNWDADLFDQRTIERWVECFQWILQGMVDGRCSRLDQLPILTGRERHEVIERFNATSAPLPNDCLIHELFEAQVRRSPHVPAVVHCERSLTYGELNTRANQLAHRLRRKGLGPDRLAGLYFDRSLEMLVGLLGTLKAGGAYLPLDPNYPAERLKYMLGDAQPSVVLTQQHLLSRLGALAAEVIVLDDDSTGLSAEPTCDLERCPKSAQSNCLAYVIYTSGSTGQPKGVMIEHHNVVSLWQGLEELYSCARTCQRVAVNASFNFDASVKQYIQLLSGRTLVLIPEQYRWEAAQLLNYLDEQQVEAIDCTPSQLRTWIAAGLLERAQASLRLVLIGGEPVDAELWARAAANSTIDFFNVYGPTECTVDATFVRLEPAASSSIGPPMQNRRIYILDGYRRPQPVGVLGEIYIGGGGVGRGYLQRPELTSQRFLADPFSATPGARLYRTGDVGRWRANGTIEYAGRNDDQVKIRGFRIELSEIEACLACDEGVKEAVVIAREEASGDQRLVAYVTQRGSVPLTPAKLQAFAKASLPDYMVPSAFVVLEQLPLTPSAKLDRRALPAPQLSDYVRREYEPPHEGIEKSLAELWRPLLQNDHIGRRDNFFDLGGHSLLAIKALFHINQRLGCALQVNDLYRHPTLQELAARIGGAVEQDQLVELAREATLDAELIALPGKRRVPEQAILLTGATGFLGRFLLVQLLRSTSATIYCLVRASSQEQAALRLKGTLRKWGLWREEFAPRLVMFCGDLRMPRLGVDPAIYELLCRRIDSIYHCATSMNHLETYAMARPANVGSAKELLKIATRCRRKLINHLSTVSIFSAHGLAADRIVDEASSIDQEQHFTADGYVASKWVSEKIFLDAADRGIPCNVFRLGLVWADTEQGRYDELQRVYRIFKSSLICGYGIEGYRFQTPPMPVDHVAHAVVALADRQEEEGKGVFHLAAAGPPIERVFERCNEIAGVALELLPFYDWLREIKRLHERGHSLPAVPLVQYAFSMSETEFYEQQRQRQISTLVSAERTRAMLDRAGVVMTVTSDELLKGCMQGMLRWDAQLLELRERRLRACASD